MTSGARLFIGKEIRPGSRDYKIGKLQASWYKLVIRHAQGSLMAEVSKMAMDVHALEVERVHNDTTSLTFAGAYETPSVGAVAPKVGFNKDHRPDCKQIVFGLNITEDGHVPLSFQLYDGNQADVNTHRPNWDGLRKLLEKEDFIYVADSKLCALESLSILPSGGDRSLP